MLPKFLLPHQRVKWRPCRHNRMHQATKLQPPSAVAWHVFDEPKTLRARQVCRRAGVTLNTFLLENLTKAIRPFLDNASSTVPWMIPVNLRGKVVRDRDTANYSSYISVKMQPQETVQDIHQNIYAALDRGEHWGNWYGYRIGTIWHARHQKILDRKGTGDIRNGISAAFQILAIGIRKRKSLNRNVSATGCSVRRFCVFRKSERVV